MTIPRLSSAARHHLLALADDEHIIGARHARWIGLGPFLEEDLAFCSIAQDELGHAISLYELVLADGEPVSDRDIDHFALLRAPEDYRSCWLVEAPCTSWNDALVRHWLYDLAERHRWEALLESSVPSLSERAAQALREEEFHRSHGELLMQRALDSTPDARAMIDASLASLVSNAAGLWDPLVDEAEALDEGVVTASSSELAQRWASEVADSLASWNVADAITAHELEQLVADRSAEQRNRQQRSAEFAPLLASLQEVITLDTAAEW